MEGKKVLEYAGIALVIWIVGRWLLRTVASATARSQAQVYAAQIAWGNERYNPSIFQPNNIEVWQAAWAPGWQQFQAPTYPVQPVGPAGPKKRWGRRG